MTPTLDPQRPAQASLSELAEVLTETADALKYALLYMEIASVSTNDEHLTLARARAYIHLLAQQPSVEQAISP